MRRSSARRLVVGVLVLGCLSVASAATMPTGAWPSSTGAVRNNTAMIVPAGTVFDGHLQTFERSDITCTGQQEGGRAVAMFIVGAGATLRNVIIGKNQREGVHCENHDCVIENVWWDDVCEDALTIKGGSAGSITRIIGGGARFAEDKVVQHNGPGTVSIDGFFVNDFGKLYRSCGTCGNTKRTVSVSNVYAVNPKVSIVTVNANFGDEATLKNIKVESSKPSVTICERTNGESSGEPTKIGAGADGVVCKYDPADIQFNGAPESRSSASLEAPVPAPAAVPAPAQAQVPGPAPVSAPVPAPAQLAAFVPAVAASPAAAPQPMQPNDQFAAARVTPPESLAGIQPMWLNGNANSQAAPATRNWWNFGTARRE